MRLSVFAARACWYIHVIFSYLLHITYFAYLGVYMHVYVVYMNIALSILHIVYVHVQCIICSQYIMLHDRTLQSTLQCTVFIITGRTPVHPSRTLQHLLPLPGVPLSGRGETASASPGQTNCPSRNTYPTDYVTVPVCLPEREGERS